MLPLAYRDPFSPLFVAPPRAHTSETYRYLEHGGEAKPGLSCCTGGWLREERAIYARSARHTHRFVGRSRLSFTAETATRTSPSGLSIVLALLSSCEDRLVFTSMRHDGLRTGEEQLLISHNRCIADRDHPEIGRDSNVHVPDDETSPQPGVGDVGGGQESVVRILRPGYYWQTDRRCGCPQNNCSPRPHGVHPIDPRSWWLTALILDP